MFPSPRSVHRVNHSRRGDTAKVVIIVLASLFGLFLITCAGVGVLGYVWWQKNLSRAMLTKPEDIRTLTAEMVDITLPPEFQPQMGMAMFGMKTVSYRWCPSGTCPPLGTDDNMNTLSLAMFSANGDNGPGVNVEADGEETMSDEFLKESYVNYTKEVREFTIGGKACKFYFVRGEMRDWSEMDEEGLPLTDSPEPTTDVAPAATQSDVATENAAVAEPPAKGTGKPIVSVQGSFPGKTGQIMLNLNLSADQYDEEKFLAVLQSIR